MPELPEVESVAAELRRTLIGERIAGSHVLWSRTLAEPTPELLATIIKGQVVVDVGRRGKYLLIHLDRDGTLVCHLRMTGRLEIMRSDNPDAVGPHVRAWFDLAGGRRLVFTDARKFGRIWLVRDLAQVTGKLGPEPLDWDFTTDSLTERLRGRRSRMKALLLDQSFIAGLGNIYADEALFLARLHPLRTADSLSHEEIEALHDSIQSVLRDSIGQRGTTLRDYRPSYGAEGAYQNHLRVYGQEDHPCPRCGSPIRRIRVSQRSTHFCPVCQAETIDGTKRQ